MYSRVAWRHAHLPGASREHCRTDQLVSARGSIVGHRRQPTYQLRHPTRSVEKRWLEAVAAVIMSHLATALIIRDPASVSRFERPLAVFSLKQTDENYSRKLLLFCEKRSHISHLEHWTCIGNIMRYYVPCEPTTQRVLIHLNSQSNSSVYENLVIWLIDYLGRCRRH